MSASWVIMGDVFCVDFSTRNLPTDARGCSNSVTVYESHDVLKEDETCTGWSHGDRCNLLSDQQTADIIRFVHSVACNFTRNVCHTTHS